MIIKKILTTEEKNRIRYMWRNCPCTFDEIFRDINQFRDEPVSEEEIENVIFSL